MMLAISIMWLVASVIVLLVVTDFFERVQDVIREYKYFKYCKKVKKWLDENGKSTLEDYEKAHKRG